MIQPLYLDANSAHSAGFSTAFHNFNWPIPQDTYDSIAWGFINFLEDLMKGTELDENERLDLALSIVPIANESFFYAGSYMIIDSCIRDGREYIFSDDCFYYQAISEYRLNPTNSLQHFLLQMQQNRQRGFRSKYLSSGRKILDRYVLSIKSKKHRPNVYQMTTNKLMKEWTISSKYISLRSLAATTGWGLEYIGQQRVVTAISDHIARRFVEMLRAHQFIIDDLFFEYMRQMCAIHLSIARFWRNKNHEKYFDTSESILLTGTAGGFESRLLSHVFQRNNLPVIRFTHGADRGLMNDYRWHYPELMFADYYLVHGHTEAKRVSEGIMRKTSSLTKKDINVIGVGSKFHNSIREHDSDSKSIDKVHDVMVVSSSFLGEIRPAFTQTSEEPVYLEWHLRLLEFLKGTKYNVISKRHFKGSKTDKRLFTGFVNDELLGGGFSDMTTIADAFVFDFAASAFMEALCTNKPVVLIDVPFRPLVQAGREQLEQICTVVRAEYDEHNKVIANFDEVKYGLQKPVNTILRQEFLNDYLFAPSVNLSEFTDLIDRFN